MRYSRAVPVVKYFAKSLLAIPLIAILLCAGALIVALVKKEKAFEMTNWIYSLCLRIWSWIEV